MEDTCANANVVANATIEWHPETNTVSWTVPGSSDPEIVDLNEGETLLISFSNFPEPSGLQLVVFTPADDLLNELSWAPTGESNLEGRFSLCLSSTDLASAQLSIEDTENPNQPSGYFLNLSGTASDSQWSLDPEVINQPGHTGPDKPRLRPPLPRIRRKDNVPYRTAEVTDGAPDSPEP